MCAQPALCRWPCWPEGQGRERCGSHGNRKQIQSLKDDYEARIRALEDKLKDAEAKAVAPAAPAPLPSSGGANAGLAAFNPAMSLVLQGRYANLSQDPNNFAIAGFAPGGEIGPGRRGFSLGETELTASASVDHLFAAQATLSVTPENEISVEEAYAIFTGAPYGLAPKFGRFFSGIGYLNEQHQHAWDFVDAPLAYQAFLGGQYRNDGLQVKWVAPIEQFLELGAEVGSGEAFPGSDRNKNGIGSGALYAHMGGDVGDSNSWRAGVSWLRTKSDERSAKDDTGIVDFVWKWAPNGNARETSFKCRANTSRKEKGETAMDSPVVVDPASYSLTQNGWYLQSGLSTDPAVARGRALRQPRSRRGRSVQSPQVDRDGGLEPVGVQPRAAAVRAQPDGGRRHGQPGLRAVHPEFGRARRAQVLKGAP